MIATADVAAPDEIDEPPTRGEIVRPRSLGPACTTAGAVVVTIAAFLPWISTGTTWRSSFGLVRGLELIGYVHGSTAWLLDAWYLVPAMAAGIWLAAFTGQRRVLVVLGSVLVLLVLAVAGTVALAPVRTGIGPWLALAGAAAALAGIVMTVRERGETT